MNFTKAEIYGKGNSIILQHPKCSKKSRELHIYNASRVVTEKREDDCGIILILNNCKGVNVIGGVTQVRMISSQAEKVILPRVTQFDLEDSTVEEVSLTVYEKKSTLVNSTIEQVTSLEIDGDFHFEMTDCTLGYVKSFIYKNNYKNPLIQKLTVGRVYPDGIRVLRGSLKLEAMIDVVESLGIQVLSGASLYLQFGKIQTFYDDSIEIMSDTNLSIHKVTFGNHPYISFTFKDASILVYPLSFLKGPWVAPMGWIAIGVAVGLVVGCVATAALTYFVKKKFFFRKSLYTDILLTKEQFPLQAEKDIDSNCNKQDSQKAMPAPPNRPLPNVPHETSPDEYYDEVLSDLPSAPAETAPQPGVAPRPSCALPKESQLTKPSLSLSIKDRFRGKSIFLPPVKKHSKQGSRDALPPPPPPLEEVYDDPGDMSLQFPPPPPPTVNRPQQPVPLPSPDEGEELYDELEDISVRPPPAPPNANKPILDRGGEELYDELEDISVRPLPAPPSANKPILDRGGEDLYDELEDISVRPPPAPPSANKPILDRGGEELYDELEDISVWPPPPPSSANKPILGKGKPAPPPPLRKPIKR
ncbi:uncharacterized protein LOC123512208 isoform X2 [Portunus trituberculatus]|nr:uncharacterized protein LOC123512208 isoform X2 [Portunus trituberculatus]